MSDKLEIVVNNTSEDRLAADPNVPIGLEEAFSSLVKFEDDVRKQRTKLIQNVADCLFNAGITKVTVVHSLYKSLYFWYIKYRNFDVSIMKLEENKARFNSIYDLEVAYPEMRASIKVRTYDKEPRRLQYTRPGK